MNVYIKTSAQHGKGVFAARALRTGEPVVKFGGPLLRREQVNFDDYHLQIGTELYLGPSGQADDYVNHSCNPNTGFGADLTLIALRDIAPDEEITWDYSTAIDEADFAGFPCCCGAPVCRKVVTSFRDLAPADQRRLAPYLLPYLKAQHASHAVRTPV
jgi:SET domain-containing protein